ncbi:hypothetical protein ACHRVW_19755 [Flavobacterium collinsii]|jgi:hypothetical protein|uniref:Uncharacterized protein n=1 Tax=Flavobacterium collinsii TaxID=1114861 RepID=A0A9W4TL21_9FLAO|nr:hypothetical protein [Flavobacterium collinsii]GIQ57190.1 hypothetical protein Flavo103_03260 [Flavobacterium collinsii]CAA9203268.1 hypothetical protein FLACOL7796_04667 [Flavobacterium collinsii]CAI2769142.1 conserved protein of unknown function [Flavobacterium collinsii]
MNQKQIKERIAQLYITLQFCSEKIRTFTAGERICINQERFQWFHILNNPEAEPRPVSLQIESKIGEVTKLISKYHFTPYYENPFIEEDEPASILENTMS